MLERSKLSLKSNRVVFSVGHPLSVEVRRETCAHVCAAQLGHVRTVQQEQPRRLGGRVEADKHEHSSGAAVEVERRGGAQDGIEDGEGEGAVLGVREAPHAEGEDRARGGPGVAGTDIFLAPRGPSPPNDLAREATKKLAGSLLGPNGPPTFQAKKRRKSSYTTELFSKLFSIAR